MATSDLGCKLSWTPHSRVLGCTSGGQSEVPRPNRWDDVVAAAAKVFRQRGFADASVEEIALEVGMLKGSLYNYVSSKEELLAIIARPPAEALLARLREVVDTDLPATELLRQVARTHVAVLEETFDFAAVYLHEVAGRALGEEWVAMDHEYTSLLEAIVRRGVDEGSLRSDLDVHVVAMAFVGALNWLTRWWHPEGRLAGAVIAEQVADMVLAGTVPRRRGFELTTVDTTVRPP